MEKYDLARKCDQRKRTDQQESCSSHHHLQIALIGSPRALRKSGRTGIFRSVRASRGWTSLWGAKDGLGASLLSSCKIWADERMKYVIIEGMGDTGEKALGISTEALHPEYFLP